MTLTLELTPEETRLVEQARVRGVDVNALLHLALAQLSWETTEPSLYETATPEAWEAFMDELAAGGESLPVLPSEAYDRENLYEDRL